MADQVREIERKYETPEADGLPDLTGVPGVASVADRGVTGLDAVYYDTPGERLAADGITLRRRTGGDDEGWHLKLPVGPDTREEIRAPLSEDVPRYLAALVRSRVRDAPLVPVVRLRTDRDLRHLVGADGAVLAEVCVDAVTAERLAGGSGTARWTEIEAELREGTGPDLLDTVEQALLAAGARRAAGPSKLARALAETAPGVTGDTGAAGETDGATEGAGGPSEAGTPGWADTARRSGMTEKAGKSEKAGKKGTAGGKGKKKPKPGRRTEPPERPTAGDHLLRYLRTQVTAIIELDPAVRRDQPDSVHRMRVATRRLRSAFRSFRTVLDREVTDPVGDELKWLAAELGVDRDREVLTERLHERLAELPHTLLVGPVRGRLRTWSNARRSGSRHQVIGVLDSHRYLDLLTTLDRLVADPPLLPDAGRPPMEVLPGAVLREARRLSRRMAKALDTPEGHERDVAMHEARKAAKRTRYAAETAEPAIGKPAKRFVRHMKNLQDVLGDHQDSVVARDALRDLALRSQAAGESAFTFGVLYGHEEMRAAAREHELPRAWKEASRKKYRTALRG
ncbi:CHAD domain-containing protein [Streptomyces sp. bgisy100]|uniref:CYTH and CHAD domain-containing protein n=1 Tax=Streptomyces sp. bgisy100 TaxID=3413783 RepID=UPI003D73AC02